MKSTRRGKQLEPYAPVARTRSVPIDWATWLRRVERARRLLQRSDGLRPRLDPPGYYILATATSFQLDGHDLAADAVKSWLVGTSSNRPIRSRLEQRVRNHVAILRRIEVSIRLGEPLRTGSVVRWYTSISAGLAPTDLLDGSLMRLDQIVRRINSPQLRLQPAVQEIAATHVQHLLDPIVPSFNGILSRLLLRYHLGRCHLPPVIFDPHTDPATFGEPTLLLPRMLDLIAHSYDALLEVAG